MASADTLLLWLAPQPGERILDAGCGMGFLSARLAAAGAAVTGIDILPHLLEQARIAAPGCRWEAADLLDYRPEQPFDAVFAHATLSWVHPPDRAARQLASLLRPAGRLAAFLGGASGVAAELEAYYLPGGGKYARLLRKAGFVVERWEEAEGGLFVLARKAD